MSAAELLPWHQAVWADLSRRRRLGRFPHALLLTGPEGLGKRRLAEQLAASLLCQRADADSLACGGCGACRQLAQDTHADLQRATLAEDSRQIKVDQLRELNAFLNLKSQYGGYRLAIVDPAERMNSNAANALLKTLEEPAPGVVVLLVSSQPSRLAVTVRSRCQKLAMAPPPPAQAREWLLSQPRGAEAVELLPLAGGAPLAALAMAEAGIAARRVELRKTLEALATGQATPVEAAEAWQAQGAGMLVPLLLGVVADLVRLAGAGEAATGIGDAGRLRQLLDGVDLLLLYKYLDRLLEARRHLNHPLSEQLLLEDLFIGWQMLHRPEATNR